MLKRWQLRLYFVMKRLLDMVLAGTALILLSPVLLTIAIIRRHSVERRVTIFVSGAGLIAGGLAAEEVLFDAMQN